MSQTNAHRGGSRGSADGDRRHRRGSRYGSSSGYTYGYGALGFGYPWSWYWGAWGPYGYGPYGYGSYGYGPYGYGGGSGWYESNAGALDLDIKPEEAEIYLDGQRIGIADNFDGFPRYLWLREGTYHLVIFKEGYQTLGKEIKLSAGVVVDLDDEMVPGVSKSPQEVYAQLRPVEETRSRERSSSPRLAPWRFRDAQQGGDREGAGEGDEESWRRRGSSARPPAVEEPTVQVDRREEPGRLEISVTPSDGVVYLDGELLGSGSDLAELGVPILVDAGKHVIEVSRPGYATRTINVEVDRGEREEVKVTLVRQ